MSTDTLESESTVASTVVVFTITNPVVCITLNTRDVSLLSTKAMTKAVSLIGVMEISIADTIGKATPRDVRTLLDALLRLPYEMIVSESYAPQERQTARERMDLAIRRLKSADEEAAERDDQEQP